MWRGGTDPENDLAIVDPGLGCFAVTGEVNPESGPYSFVAAGISGPSVYSAVTLDGASARSEYRTSSGFETLETVPLQASEWSSFTAYVADRQLLVIVDGRVAGAVEAMAGTSGFGFRPWSGDFRIRNLQVLVPNNSVWNPCRG